MSSDPRHGRRALCLGALALAGCGFTPALAPGGSALVLRDRVAVVAPATIPGFTLRAVLEERLGRGTGPYTLTVGVDEALEAAARSRRGDTLRYSLVGVAGWTLSDADGRALGTGEVESFTGYAASGSTVATQTAATDARGRLMTILADRIVADLTLLDLPR